MTWAEFKQKMEAAGATDDMEVSWIDIGCGDDFDVKIVVWDDGSRHLEVS